MEINEVLYNLYVELNRLPLVQKIFKNWMIGDNFIVKYIDGYRIFTTQDVFEGYPISETYSYRFIEAIWCPPLKSYYDDGRSLWEMIDWKNLPHVHVHESGKMSLINDKEIIIQTEDPVIFTVKTIILQNNKGINK